MTMTEVALALRGEFDGRAADLDRAGGFPTQNYARMREAGYLRGLVPADLGGLGGDLADGVSAQRALGWACASTALAVNMHHFQVGAATGEVLVVGLPMSLPGISVIETWDTLGMRGTASHDVLFEDVRVPASAIAARLPANAPAWDTRFANAIKWFLPLLSGVYVGIADRARDEGLSAAWNGNNSSFRDAPLTEALVGQLETAHFRAAAALELGVQRVAAAPDPVAAMIAAITLKDAATESAVEVVDLAVQIAGGKAYFKKSLLERLVRDVRAARHHPPSAPVSSQMIGRGVLQQHEAVAAVEAAVAVTAN